MTDLACREELISADADQMLSSLLPPLSSSPETLAPSANEQLNHAMTGILPHHHVTTLDLNDGTMTGERSEAQTNHGLLGHVRSLVNGVIFPPPMSSVIPNGVSGSFIGAVDNMAARQGVSAVAAPTQVQISTRAALQPAPTEDQPEDLHLSRTHYSFSRKASNDETEDEILLLPDNFVSGDTDLSLKAKLLATLGWRMASCGAETRLIVQSVKKMAHDLGCNSIDLSITRDGILVKLRRGNSISVEFKEVKHFAINMDSLARLHQICLRVSEGKLRDPNKIFLAIRAVRPRHYNHNHIIFIEAVAGACFAYLNGGNLAVCASALIGGIFLMFSRFLFIKRGFFESFTFMMSACIGSLVAALVCNFGFHASPDDTILAATATTLLLVPGFPMINGFLDIFKGYVPIGLTRLVIAAVLVISAAVGLLTTNYFIGFMITMIPL